MLPSSEPTDLSLKCLGISIAVALPKHIVADLHQKHQSNLDSGIVFLAMSKLIMHRTKRTLPVKEEFSPYNFISMVFYQKINPSRVIEGKVFVKFIFIIFGITRLPLSGSFRQKLLYLQQTYIETNLCKLFFPIFLSL